MDAHFRGVDWREPHWIRSLVSFPFGWTSKAPPGEIMSVEGAGPVTAARLRAAFKELDGGYVSVSAPAVLREELELAGTRYLPMTVAKATGTSLLRSAVSGGSLLLSGIGSSLVNLYEYGLGDQRDEGIGSQGFWVSTGVDFGLSVATGIVAATGVAIVAAGAAVVVGTAVAAPALVIGAAIAGLGLSLYLDHKDIPDRLKAEANAFVDARETELLMLEDAPTQRVAPKAPPTPLR